MKIAPAGDRALLVELGDVAAGQLHGAAAAVRTLPAVLACIVGQSSLYVIFETEPDQRAVRDAIREAQPAARSGAVRRLTVGFRDEHGPDLDEFLSSVGTGREEFFERLRDLRLIVRYLGFRGGFGYLDGWPREWAMPRRPTSRPRVPRGTFAIAGSVAAFYPIDSPGGWNLLGRTDTPLEFALAPGDEIEIEPTLSPLEKIFGAPVSSPAPHAPFPLNVIPTPFATLVAAPDWLALAHGHPPGGPFDPEAAACANRAAGNAPGHAVLECALVGPRAVAQHDVVCSWYGAEAEIRVGETLVADPRQFDVAAGQEIVLGKMIGGMRGWLAAGASRGEVGLLAREERLTIRTLAGPHESPLRELLCEVTPQLDRVGIRMRPLSATGIDAPSDLRSCGMQCGTIQLHPDGSVVVMGPDHPVTGGYLQPMTVISSELWKLAQLTVGDRALFVTQFVSP